MTDGEFDAVVREVQRKIAADMYDARRERREGATEVMIRYNHGVPVRPLTIKPVKNYDVKL